MTTTASRDDASPDPGKRAAKLARDAIEDVLFGLAEIPFEFDRKGVRDRLLRAIQFLYAVLDSPVTARVHLDGLTESERAISESRVLLERAAPPTAAVTLARALEHLLAANVALRAGAEAVSQIHFERRFELSGGGLHEELPKARPFRASLGVPSLHALSRPPLLPDVIVDPSVPRQAPAKAARSLPRPATFEALKALAGEMESGALERRLLDDEAKPTPSPEEIFPLAYEPAVEEVEMLRRIGRDLLETVACFRNLRKPNAIETWLDQAPFEQRLLDNLDAFAALGGAALPLVSLFHAEAKAPDAERAFAAALTLGSIEGSDTVGAAVMILKQSAPEEHPGWIEGFWLAPNRAIDVAMVDLCTGRRPELVALALDVLHARGTTTAEGILPLLSRVDPAITARVARALGVVLPPELAIPELERILGAAKTDDVFLAAAQALLCRRHDPVLDVLCEAIDAATSAERVAGASWLLCLAGRPSDLDRLLVILRAAPTPRFVRALGRFGHVDTLPALRDALEHGDAEVVAAAAEALERITGAGLRETVEEPWEVDLPEEVLEAEGALPIPTRKVEKVVTRPEVWAAWLRKHQNKLDARLRYRGGAPFVPMRIVEELEGKATPPSVREDASIELSIATGLGFRFSPHDWVAKQKTDLAELRAAVAALRPTPGEWGFMRRAPHAFVVADVEQTLPPLHEATSSAALPFQSLPQLAWLSRLPPGASAETTLPPLGPDERAMVLPFRERGPSEVVVVDQSAANERSVDSGDFAAQTLPPDVLAPRPALPFQQGREQGPEDPLAKTVFLTPDAAAPTLSLEAHASLCAELALSPGDAERIFAKHGLASAEHRTAVDDAWKERLRREPKLYEDWQRLYRMFYARLRG